MRKFVNFRCFLVVLGILLCVIILLVFINVLWVTLTVALVLCLLPVAVLLSLAHPTPRFVLTLLLICVCGAAASFGIFYTQSSWKSELIDERYYVLEGRVSAVATPSEKAGTVTLERVTADGAVIKGKLRVYITAADGIMLTYMRPGDTLRFSAKPEFISLYQGHKPNGSAYFYGTRYFAYADETNVTLITGSMRPIEAVRQSMRDTLNDNLNYYGEIAYGMVTGEKGGIEYGVRNYYNVSGLSHILAVSGLHVGFLSGALLFLLKALRVHRYARLPVVLAFLIFYCFLAGFSPGVLRASIMCVYGMVADLLGRRRDSLNSLCLAGVLLLTVKPYYLFCVSFQMSMSAVLGLVLFSSFFERGLKRILPKRTPAFIGGGIAVSLAAQLGITPVTVYHFKTFPTFSVLTNIIVLPLLKYSFIAVFVCMLLSMAIPPMGIVLSFSGVGLAAVDTVAQFVASLPFSYFRVFGGAVMFFVLVLYFLLSRFVRFDIKSFKYARLGFRLLCIVLTATVFGVSNLSPFGRSAVNLILLSAPKDVSSLIVGQYVCLVGDLADDEAAVQMLYAAKRRRIDAVFVYDLSTKTANNILSIHNEFAVKTVYFPDTADMKGMYAVLDGGIDIVAVKPGDTVFDITAAESSGVSVYLYENAAASVLFLPYGVSETDLDSALVNRCGIIRSNTVFSDFNERLYLVNESEDDSVADAVLQAKNRICALNLKSGRVRGFAPVVGSY